MEYNHIISEREIKTGRLGCVKSNIDPESLMWFENHSGTKVNIYNSYDGSLIRKNAVIGKYQKNSWQLSCGSNTFKGLTAGDIVLIKERSDGHLEIKVGRRSLETLTLVQPLFEYNHILTSAQIKSGSLYIKDKSLESVVRPWFEKHTGEYIAIYKSDGSLVKRNIMLNRNHGDGASWRLYCGKDTFKGLQPGDTVVIINRGDDKLEIQIGNQVPSHLALPYNIEQYGVPTDNELASFRLAAVGQQPTKLNSPTRPSFEVEYYTPTRRSIPEQRQKQVFLGEPLNFRGLQHAPINEQGVVFLFGMVCKEFGYLIEAVQTGFPDCEGKRRVDNQRWQRVRIEFEFKSSNFLKHGHNAELCDLIVCWEHDWRNCPLEVLELRKEIQNLNNNL